ncbi:hypothetical protein MMC14_007881 [Varicellaria rhodocarpa]|nr:hypothetical protein [Varicellaria rhodocarpa]
MTPSPPPSPSKDPTTPSLQAQAQPQPSRKQSALIHKISTLQDQIATATAKINAIKPQLKNPSPSQTVSAHIKLLHTYNEMRDVGMGLLGIIADNRGVRVRDVYEEFGVGVDD